MQITNQCPLLTAITAVFFLASCASNEIGQSKDVNQATIYQEYEVTYNEKEGQTETSAQFRFAGANGTTLVLNPPSKFEFDGEPVKVDSSDFEGAFYKTVITGSHSAGKHWFSFTDMDNRKFENEFAMETFRLLDIPAAFSRTQAANIRFEAPVLLGDDYVTLSTDHTDSSFTISHMATDSGNTVSIPAAQLQRQQQKDITLYATLYRTIPLKQQAKEGGAIKITQITRPVTIKLED